MDAGSVRTTERTLGVRRYAERVNRCRKRHPDARGRRRTNDGYAVTLTATEAARPEEIRVALLVGAPAPDFTLPGWFQSAEQQFSLGSRRGYPVVLAFYPGDERLVCTRQMCAYSDNLGDLHRFEAEVWGIAPQSVESHQAFADGRRLKMPLLSDMDKIRCPRVRRRRRLRTASVGVHR